MLRLLIIVESPAKARTIQKLFRGRVKVEASMGHVRDLPRSRLGVDEDNDFAPKYVTIRGKGEILKKLREHARKARQVYLATDPDREGEAISWHLAHSLGLDPDHAVRIEFREVTREAIERAIDHPRPIDAQLVQAQQARRILDRLVGYKLSPLLWRKVRRGLSAGRVQSAALRLIGDREADIQAHVPEEYWTVLVHLEGGLVARYWGTAGHRVNLREREQVDRLLAETRGIGFEVEAVRKNRRRRNPPAPFITSSLQQEAFRRLGFPVRKTMRVAQQLYEGLELGDQGTSGLITYMRTDSTRVAETARERAREYVIGRFGREWVGEGAVERRSPRVQGAHEAIRPTEVVREPEAVAPHLMADQARLYRLIWERFVASQMAPAEMELTAVHLKAGEHAFRASGSVVTFPGFTSVYQPGERTAGPGTSDPVALAAAGVGQQLAAVRIEDQRHVTQPPSRYTEASLVKALEELGIGRPSTYAPIVETLGQRGYVANEDRSLRPTELGLRVLALLKEYFPDIVDSAFTAGLEQRLDAVEVGKYSATDVLRDFYEPFQVTLERAEREIGGMEVPDEVTDIACERCGKPMVVKYSRFGKFLGCSGFPDCRASRPYLEPTGVNCPECGAEVVSRRSRKGKRFYGCSRYPECTFSTWRRPVARACPDCGAFLVEGRDRDAGQYLACVREQCGHREYAELDAPDQ
ncbi:MAG TPA: type I DNA topoisomerase [Bacillota bacterium]|nr:type I DNA topoisomerase [Bacillota bacterium]